MPSSPRASANSIERAGDLISALSTVPDPRDPRGVRYPLPGMLAAAVCAVLAGARSFAAIGEWALDLSEEQLDRLRLGRAPVESTLRKLFARLDAAALDAALAVYAWCRVRHIGGRRVIAIDGKTIRGARSRNVAAPASAPHLIAALDHATGVVVGQHAVAAKSNEIPAVRDLIASFDAADLRGCVITLDAMHTQHDTAAAIVDAGADYVFTVEANQPTLLAALKALPWTQVPRGSQSTQHGHGRRATRTIKVIEAPTALPGWPAFHGLAQVAQLRRTVTKAAKKTIEVVYLLTSATHHDAPPATLAAWVQGHWGIENTLHWVRDVTYDEDRSRSAPATPLTSWPPCATSPSQSCACPAPPTSPPPYDTTPVIPKEPSHAR
ncbi:ISAs1 family transposase [Nocardioides alcanivorans]|uniref:ISAs1 family transposase n=1 Tax=Nocardioides alcanivorans TaxID=2897352 RepID=UPI001F1DFEA1|nr:ISAs1 family transposase [Nocardioides alcanivorans]